MPPISSSRLASVDIDALALGVPDEPAAPLPSAGMRAISEICNSAAASAAALSRAAASGGLGNLIGGNYTPVAPPVQRITDMNNSGLAGLGALGALGASVGSASSGGARVSESPPSGTSTEPSTSAASVPAEAAPVADAPAAVPADAPAGDAGASTAETSSVSEADEDAPRPRRRARARAETHEDGAVPVVAPDEHPAEAAAPVVEAPPPVDEAHHLPPETGLSLEMPDPSDLSPEDRSILESWLIPDAAAPVVEGGAHTVDPGLDPSVLPH